jgi:hypothetical protein
MNKTISVLLALALCVVPVTAFGAAANPLVGGVPIFFHTSGDSAATAADVTVTLPYGFLPDHCVFIDDHDATAPDYYQWSKSMANNSSNKIEGSTGVITYESVDGSDCGLDFTTTSGSVIIDVNCQVNSGDYLLNCWRYSQ